MPCSATASGSVERGVLEREVVGHAQRVGRADRSCSRRTRPASRSSSAPTRPRSTQSDGRPARQYSHSPHLGDWARRSTRSPTVQPVTPSADGGDRARELVALDHARAAAPLHEEVQVGAADPAVADLEQQLARARAAGVGRSSTATSRRPMNTAAGIVWDGGIGCVMAEASPEPDTGVNYVRLHHGWRNVLTASCARDCGGSGAGSGVGHAGRRCSLEESHDRRHRDPGRDRRRRHGSAPAPGADVAHHRRRRSATSATGSTATRVLDAAGHIVTPGFVDIHTHYDAQVFWDPALVAVAAGTASRRSWPATAASRSRRCGREHRELLVRTLQHVEDMAPDTLFAGVPWDDFETFPQYLDAIERRGTLLNYACYVGHTAVRIFVMGEAGYEQRRHRRRGPRHAAGDRRSARQRARPASRPRRRRRTAATGSAGAVARRRPRRAPRAARAAARRGQGCRRAAARREGHARRRVRPATRRAAARSRGPRCSR